MKINISVSCVYYFAYNSGIIYFILLIISTYFGLPDFLFFRQIVFWTVRNADKVLYLTKILCLIVLKISLRLKSKIHIKY